MKNIRLHIIGGLIPLAMNLAGAAELDTIVDDQFTDFGLEVMAAQTDLAIVAVVKGVEYRCNYHEGTSYPQSSIAVLDLLVTESIFGCPESDRIQVLAYGVPRPECMVIHEATHPAEFMIGSSYFLMCFKPFLSHEKRFDDEWICRNHDLFCLDSNNDIEVCYGELKFGIPHPLRRFREIFERLDPDSMYQQADVVVVASEFELPESDERMPIMQAVPSSQRFSCLVQQTLKGDVPNLQLLVSVYADNTPVLCQYVTPVIDHTDRALLFLVKSDNGYELLWNYRGYCPLSGAGILNSSRIDTGYELDGHNRIRENQ